MPLRPYSVTQNSAKMQRIPLFSHKKRIIFFWGGVHIAPSPGPFSGWEETSLFTPYPQEPPPLPRYTQILATRMNFSKRLLHLWLITAKRQRSDCWSVHTVEMDGVEVWRAFVFRLAMSLAERTETVVLSRSSEDRVSGGVGPITSITPCRRLRQKMDITPRRNCAPCMQSVRV